MLTLAEQADESSKSPMKVSKSEEQRRGGRILRLYPLMSSDGLASATVLIRSLPSSFSRPSNLCEESPVPIRLVRDAYVHLGFRIRTAGIQKFCRAMPLRGAIQLQILEPFRLDTTQVKRRGRLPLDAKPEELMGPDLIVPRTGPAHPAPGLRSAWLRSIPAYPGPDDRATTCH